MKKIINHYKKFLPILIVVVLGGGIYFYINQTDTTPKKGPEALALESKGLAEFNPENDTIETISRNDKKVAQDMLPILKDMGDGKDITKNQTTLSGLTKIIKRYPEYADGYQMHALLSLLVGDKDYKKILDDIDSAIKYHSSEKYTSSSKTNAGNYSMRAKVDILSGNYQQAIDDLDTAIKVDPSSLNDVFNTGGVKAEDNSNITALQKDDLDLLVSKYPKDERVYIFRGLFYNSFSFYDNKYYKPATDDLLMAIKINPKSAWANYFLGDVYGKMSMFIYSFKIPNGTTADYDNLRDIISTKSLNYFEETIKIDPKMKEAYMQVAETLYSLKQYSQAIPYYDKAIELDQANYGAYNDRGLTKTYLNDNYGAISDFTDAINGKKLKMVKNNSLDPLYLGNTYESRAKAYEVVGNYDSAIADYSRAIGLKFSGQSFLMTLQQIRAIYPEFSNITDQNLLEGLRQKFYSNMASKDFVGEYTKNVKPYKDNLIADLYTERADAYLKSGNFKKASVEYSRALSSDSDYVSDRWKTISKTTDSEFSVDTQTLDFKNENLVSLWAKNLNTNDNTYSEINFQIDCLNRKIKSLSGNTYDSNGNVIYTGKEQDWQGITPETTGEILYKGMCVNN